MEDHPLKGCFRFENLPGEIIIDMKYQLQVNRNHISDDRNAVWVIVETSEDLDHIYRVRDEFWDDKITRIVKIETSLWEK